MNVPDHFHDAALHDLIRALRYEAGLSRRVLGHLRGLEKDLLAALAEAGDTTSQRKLRALLTEARQAIAERIDGAQGELDELPGFAKIQSGAAAAALNGVIGTEIAKDLTAAQAKAIASDVLVEGAPSAEWWGVQEADILQKFKNVVRTGMSTGATGDQMAREVRDMMKTSMRNAQTLVRTSVLTVNNTAHLAVFEANQDLVQGLQWVSTLDARTTPICRALDGCRWKYPDLDPVDGKTFPGPTAHWGCRSTQIPWLVSWEELARRMGGDPEVGRAVDAMSDSTRASMDGQVSDKLTYETWLKGKDAKDPGFAEQVLGPARYNLWKSGELTLGDMVDQTGHELTLAQLARR